MQIKSFKLIAVHNTNVVLSKTCAFYNSITPMVIVKIIITKITTEYGDFEVCVRKTKNNCTET